MIRGNLTYALVNSILHPQHPLVRPLHQTPAYLGAGLKRPECVLATSNCDLYTADWRGGVAHLHPDGSQQIYTGRLPDGSALRPNGIALLADGSFLLAHLGADSGGVYRLSRDGRVEPWLLEVAGETLPPTNFVLRDAAGRTWVTVSTRLAPRSLGYRRSCDDGFIVCVQPDGRASIAADGLGYTNEVAVHPDGHWLYVNETFARRLSRFALAPDGSLGRKELVTEFGPGTFPDGLAFDEAGHAWVVSIVSNRLIRVAPDGAQTLWLEDADAAHVAWVEAAFEAGRMDRAHLEANPSRVLRNISSIAFTGADRRTAVLGCLLGEQLVTLRLPVAGVAPTHWNHR
jgi:sugar lactone lactonase YvrE